tara:strand:- start:454 stop:816 length:363 start_codon:yes stop_codon:yes gene_type:complete
MAHFTRLNENSVVIDVRVLANEVITDKDGKEQEQLGIDFLVKRHGTSWWKQTSYNGTFRKHYAGVGWHYDQDGDAFYEPQPFPSWTLNKTTWEWEPPVARPSDKTKLYAWNELDRKWDTL